MDQANDDWQPTYSALTRIVKETIRDSLFAEQRGLCVYCGRQIDLTYSGRTYHIEHFRPQTTYSDLQLEYNNLFLSCGQKDGNGNPSPICGNRKDSWFDEDAHIEPTYAGCTSRFFFKRNGEVVPAADGDVSAITMIEVLGLNHPELKKDREKVLADIDSNLLDLTDFVNEDGIAESYAHIAYQHLGSVIP
jgi:uncharacterized protein (TIGR02646 family)